jgi:hypothetical protein
VLAPIPQLAPPLHMGRSEAELCGPSCCGVRLTGSPGPPYHDCSVLTPWLVSLSSHAQIMEIDLVNPGKQRKLHCVEQCNQIDSVSSADSGQ